MLSRLLPRPVIASLAIAAIVTVPLRTASAEPNASTAKSADAPRDILTSRYSEAWLKAHLLAADKWHPYATAAEREFWNDLPTAVRTAQIADGEAALKGPWESLPATLFLEYARNGNRSRYEHVRSARRNRLHALTLAECFEHKGRFLDEITNGIWLTCEETFWGVPAHLSLQKDGPGLPDVNEPVIDLFAAETGAQLAWTSYLLGPDIDNVSPLIRPRIRTEIERRILTPFLARDDFWWMGMSGRKNLNNWTPWICSNVLTCALVVETDPERREAVAEKIMRILDNFLNPYPADGGCDEGPGYWSRAGGSLFDCLELLRSATGEQLNVYDQPLIQNIARYLPRVHVADDWFVNFADASALKRGDGPLVYRFGQRIGDPTVAGFGVEQARLAGFGTEAMRETLGRDLPNLVAMKEILSAKASSALFRDVWLPDLQVMTARDRENQSAGLFMAAKGGTNGESHNHNDVGNFVVYANGRPVLVDAGVGTYTRQTFGSHRYEIWTMQSGYHNLPTINGMMEHEGKGYAATDVHYHENDQQAEFSLNIATAFPKTARVESWIRTLRLERGKGIVLTDDYSLAAVSAPLALNFLTECNVDTSVAGRLTLSGGTGPGAVENPGLVIEYDANRLNPQIDKIALDDPRLSHVWGSRLYRIRFVSEKPEPKGSYKITMHMP